MNIERVLGVVAARNREFYRDKAGLGWNLLMPILMLLGLAIVFNAPPPAQFKVGFLGQEAAIPLAFLETPHIDFIPEENEEAAFDKVRHHRIDMLLDLRAAPVYWINEESAKGELAERLLRQSQQDQDAGQGLERRSVSGRAIRYVDWVLPGVLAMNAMFSSLWGVGWVIVRYRKNGVLRRLRATPLTATEFLVAQILSRLLVVTATTAGIFAFTHVVLDFPIRGSYLALALVFLIGAVALISIGLTVAARVRSEELANGLLDVVAFPMMILSGVWFSMDGTNIWVQRLAELLPLTHLVDAARRIMLDGAGLIDVLPELGILAATALVLTWFAATRFRWQ